MVRQKQQQLDTVDTPLEFGKFVFYTFSGILVVMLGLYVYRFGITTSTSQSTWGAFGDFLGGTLNPLVSFLTLIVAVNVWRLQKRELEDTRTALEAQGKIAETQRKEQRFFDFLNLYQQTLTTVDADGKYGKTAFRHWTSANAIQYSFVYEFMVHGFSAHDRHHPKPSSIEESMRKLLDRTQTQFTEIQIFAKWNNFSPILDHYFRTVFAILREAEPTLGDTHFRYVKLFRAQLSRDELTLLTFNLLFDNEGTKMRGFVEKYGLLKHLPVGPLRVLAETKLNSNSFGKNWALSSTFVPHPE